MFMDLKLINKHIADAIANGLLYCPLNHIQEKNGLIVNVTQSIAPIITPNNIQNKKYPPIRNTPF